MIRLTVNEPIFACKTSPVKYNEALCAIARRTNTPNELAPIKTDVGNRFLVNRSRPANVTATKSMPSNIANWPGRKPFGKTSE